MNDIPIRIDNAAGLISGGGGGGACAATSRPFHISQGRRFRTGLPALRRGYKHPAKQCGVLPGQLAFTVIKTEPLLSPQQIISVLDALPKRPSRLPVPRPSYDDEIVEIERVVKPPELGYRINAAVQVLSLGTGHLGPAILAQVMHPLMKFRRVDASYAASRLITRVLQHYVRSLPSAERETLQKELVDFLNWHARIE